MTQKLVESRYNFGMKINKHFKDLLYDSHVYFETKSGLLGYTYGYHSRYDDDNMVGCVAGYFTKKSTKRIQVSTGRYVEKVIYEGNEGNLDFDERFSHLPKDIKEQLKSYTVLKKETNEKLFIIPYNEVAKVYSPCEALKEVIEGKSALDLRRQEAVMNLIKYLQGSNVSLGEIGLYGSLQIGVIHESDVIDVDTVLYGTHNYEKLLKIVSKQKEKRSIVSKYKSINATSSWKQAREVRDSCAKIYLNGNIHADVRIVRKHSETPTFNFQTLDVYPESINLEGTVTDSSESLCVPSIFKVLSENVEYNIGTRLYVFIGAAKAGNKVRIRGKKLKNSNSILIAEGKTDFITRTN